MNIVMDDRCIILMQVFNADHHMHGHYEAKSRSIVFRFREHDFVSSLALSNASLKDFDASNRYHKILF